MKAFAGLVAGLFLLSCPALGQTAPGQPATPSTPSADAAAATVAAGSFAAGAKLFLEPMDGFGQLVAEAIVKKKVPVVLVHQRAEADFVMSGNARVKKRGIVTGFVLLNTHGAGNVSITEVRTGKQVFGYTFHHVNEGVAEYYVYQGWAEGCAKHLKKALEKK